MIPSQVHDVESEPRRGFVLSHEIVPRHVIFLTVQLAVQGIGSGSIDSL